MRHCEYLNPSHKTEERKKYKAEDGEIVSIDVYVEGL